MESTSICNYNLTVTTNNQHQQMPLIYFCPRFIKVDENQLIVELHSARPLHPAQLENRDPLGQ